MTGSPPRAPSASGPGARTIDRREAVRRAALLLGGALSAPTLAAVLAGCESPRTADAAWAPRALDGEQAELVATIAEHILPQTDTPGARAAGVHRFIDTMLAEYYTPNERQRFLDGLGEVDARARKAWGRSFLQGSPEQQRTLLTEMDRAAFAAKRSRQPPPPDPEKETERGTGGSPPSREATADTIKNAPGPASAPPFFRTFKELTVLGYYTSEVGATRELRYERVPGRFEGCIPFSQVGRTWSV